MPEEELPPRAHRAARRWARKATLVADLLKLLLKIRAREIDAASRLLARSEELELLAAGVRKNLAMLEGWRFEAYSVATRSIWSKASWPSRW